MACIGEKVLIMYMYLYCS